MLSSVYIYSPIITMHERKEKERDDSGVLEMCPLLSDRLLMYKWPSLLDVCVLSAVVIRFRPSGRRVVINDQAENEISAEDLFLSPLFLLIKSGSSPISSETSVTSGCCCWHGRRWRRCHSKK